MGSNVRHVRYGRPPRVLEAAIQAMTADGFVIEALSATHDTPPLGPSRRRYANAVVLVATKLYPDELLSRLKRIERRFGRRPARRRWAARVLDLDIVLWSGGPYASAALVVPHPAYRARRFVLAPAADIAPGWRDPLSGLTIRQYMARLTRPTPLA